MYTSTQRETSGISSGSIDALRVQLMKMNSQQLQAFATANQDDAIKLGLAAEADKYRKQHAQEAMAMMSGQQQKPPIAQQILQNIGQSPQQPQQPMPPQGQGQGPMPPQGMPPQQMAQGPQQPPQGMADGGYALPEDQGIATLPVGNMDFAEGGIVAFDDGGQVPGYKSGGAMSAGESMINKALALEGVTDPVQIAFIKSLHSQESSSKAQAPTSNRGAKGPMQVTPIAFADIPNKDLDPSKDLDMTRAGVRYAVKGFTAAKGDPALAATYYYGGPGGLNAAKQGKPVSDPKNPDNPDTFSYAKSIMAKMNKYLPVATATAAPEIAKPTPAPKTAPQDQGIAALTSDPATGFSVPQDVFSPSPEEERKYAAAKAGAKKVEDVVSQIPGQSVKAPAFKDTNTYFGGVADEMGIPQEVQRNVANTINATSGWTAPVGGVNRAAAGIAKELEPTAEMIQKAAQAKQIAETPRILPPAKAGLEALDEASAATRAAAENARRARLLEQDRKAAVGAEQSVDAATKSAAIADKMAKEQAALVDAARFNQARMTGAAQGVSMMQAADNAGVMPQGGGVSDLIPETAPAMAPPIPSGMFAPVAGEEPKGLDVKDLPKDANRSDFDWNTFLLHTGLGMMSGESPHALTNIGKAGLGALQTVAAEKKAKGDRAYQEALIAHAKMPAAEVQLTEKYANDPNFRKAFDMLSSAKREPTTRESLFKEYLKSPVASIKSFSEYMAEYEKEFGSLGGGVPKGVTVSRVGQS